MSIVNISVSCVPGTTNSFDNIKYTRDEMIYDDNLRTHHTKGSCVPGNRDGLRFETENSGNFRE